MKNFLVVLPFHRGDFELALKLLGWITELGPCSEYRLLVIASHKALNVELLRVQNAAKQCFGEVFIERCHTGLEDESWPKGANMMFRRACDTVFRRFRFPFLWMEPDCVPLKRGWLDAISTEYESCSKPYMGNLRTQTTNPNLPRTYLPGCSVYPWQSQSLLHQHWNPLTTAWDVTTAAVTVPATHPTKLMYEWWGVKGLPPLFRLFKTDGGPPNVMTVDDIPQTAVFFHRCKDGALIDILNGKKQSKVETVRTNNKQLFYHSGDFGDIIYSLLFAKRYSPIKYLIGPDPSVSVRERMSEEKFRFIAPLLLRQPWIEKVKYVTQPPEKVDYNLNEFRKTWFSPRRPDNLFQCYSKHFGEPEPPQDQAWIEADPIKNACHPVVIARSSRWQNHVKFSLGSYFSRFHFVDGCSRKESSLQLEFR